MPKVHVKWWMHMAHELYGLVPMEAISDFSWEPAGLGWNPDLAEQLRLESFRKLKRQEF